MVNEAAPPAMRVTARQARRWRSGFEFGRTARDLLPADLGEDRLVALGKLLAIAEDPLLMVEVVEGGVARALTDEELAQLRALVETEQHRADPDNPPAPIFDLTSMQGDGPTQAAGEGASGPVDGEASPPLVPAVEPQNRAVGNDTSSDAPASDAGPTIADNPASDSKPAGEQTGSPAAEPKPRPHTRREKAKA